MKYTQGFLKLFLVIPAIITFVVIVAEWNFGLRSTLNIFATSLFVVTIFTILIWGCFCMDEFIASDNKKISFMARFYKIMSICIAVVLTLVFASSGFVNFNSDMWYR